VSAFVAKMNAAARSHGMTGTHYTDPSGLAASTVTTARDQLIMVRKAMAIPALAAVVAMPDATFPVGGDGPKLRRRRRPRRDHRVKTGSDSASLGCWAFAARRTIAGAKRTDYGVVLGLPATAAGYLQPALGAGEAIADAVPATIRQMTVVPAGTVVGSVQAPWRKKPVPVETSTTVEGLVGAGARLSFHVQMRAPAARTMRTAERLGSLPGSGLDGVGTTPLVAGAGAAGPTLKWGLTRT
jgi:serine-type D-Ala-D-Ala carboxypeptidase (penicillin-binding protein 5/6)